MEETFEKIEQHLVRLNHVSAALLRAERIKLLGPEPVKTVWFEDTSCKFYIPDALDDRIQGLLLVHGKFFEEALLRKIRQHIQPGASVVDVGANVGNHTMFFAKVCGAKTVHSFEPQSRLVEIIERNKVLNNLAEDQVIIHKCGCGNQNGFLRMIHNNIGNLGATQFTYDTEGDFEVRKVDDCGIEHVDFMKIDSERMGDHVLEGAADLIEKHAPKIWIELYEGEKEKSIAILESWGYKLVEAMTKADYLFEKAPA